MKQLTIQINDDDDDDKHMDNSHDIKSAMVGNCVGLQGSAVQMVVVWREQFAS